MIINLELHWIFQVVGINKKQFILPTFESCQFSRYGYRVRYFRGRVSNFNQSETREQCFLDSDWLKFETLPRKYRTLLTLSFSSPREVLDPSFDFTSLNDVDTDTDEDSQDIDSKIPDRNRIVSETAHLQVHTLDLVYILFSLY